MYRVPRTNGEVQKNRRRKPPSFYCWLVFNPCEWTDMPFVRRAMNSRTGGIPHQPTFEQLGRHLLATGYPPEDVGRGLRLFLQYERNL